ncbi:hypothetical protein PsYK624_171130 [Phanerochaete sordida]|uniref:Uncharacterized protein n=1 Tax=Phanerochaete sordida TaxID=48140 RepID=A0A9P3LMR0_9APHY|nr:hypothetical protein PsYK624_171130 [Phanerochaete sordida]
MYQRNLLISWRRPFPFWSPHGMPAPAREVVHPGRLATGLCSEAADVSSTLVISQRVDVLPVAAELSEDAKHSLRVSPGTRLANMTVTEVEGHGYHGLRPQDASRNAYIVCRE